VTESAGLALRVLDGNYAVWQTTAEEVAAGDDSQFLSVTTTPDEISVVGLEDLVPPGAAVERGWRCLQVSGPLDFGLTGVLASLSAPLAAAGIPIFVMSTFNTDYLLVKGEDLDNAIAALRTHGFAVEG
jgi:hypothetical protein